MRLRARMSNLLHFVHFKETWSPLLHWGTDTFRVITFAQPLLRGRWDFKEDRKYSENNYFQGHVPSRTFSNLFLSQAALVTARLAWYLSTINHDPRHDADGILAEPTICSGWSRLVPTHQVISGGGKPPIACNVNIGNVGQVSSFMQISPFVSFGCVGLYYVFRLSMEVIPMF